MVLSGTLSWVTVRRSCGKGEALRVQKGTPEMPLENSQTFGGHLEGTGFLPDKVGVEPEQYFCMNVDFFFFLEFYLRRFVICTGTSRRWYRDPIYLPLHVLLV